MGGAVTLAPVNNGAQCSVTLAGITDTKECSKLATTLQDYDSLVIGTTTFTKDALPDGVSAGAACKGNTSPRSRSHKAMFATRDSAMSTVRADIEIGHEGVLADLEFSDLYLEATGRAWYKTWALDPLRHEITGSALEGVTRLRQHIEASVSKREFRIKWDGVGMRGALFETQAGEMYVLRRNLPHALPFHTLGYGQRVESALLAPAIRTGGLVLFTGARVAARPWV